MPVCSYPMVCVGMIRRTLALALAQVDGCGAGISDRPCPRVTEFPAEL